MKLNAGRRPGRATSVGEFRLDHDGWLNYFGWPDAPDGTPYKFTAARHGDQGDHLRHPRLGRHVEGAVRAALPGLRPGLQDAHGRAPRDRRGGQHRPGAAVQGDGHPGRASRPARDADRRGRRFSVVVYGRRHVPQRRDRRRRRDRPQRRLGRRRRRPDHRRPRRLRRQGRAAVRHQGARRDRRSRARPATPRWPTTCSRAARRCAGNAATSFGVALVANTIYVGL